MAFLPSLSALGGKSVLLIGSGPAAVAALHTLVDAGAQVRWLSRSIDVAEDIWLQRRPFQIEITFRDLKPTDFDGVAAVIAAVGEPLARCLSEQASAAGCPILVIGRPDLSTLHLDEPPSRHGGCKPSSAPSPMRRAGTWLWSHVAGAALAVSAAIGGPAASRPQRLWRNASSGEGATAKPT
jgi:hypothetical protein